MEYTYCIIQGHVLMNGGCYKHTEVQILVFCLLTTHTIDLF